MADNYLEKQYAQYEAKKAEWERARKLGLIKKRPLPSTKQAPKPEEPDEKR
ncbi:MAG: hypothetical protein RR382_08130 [Tannerellaceae bacterium]